MLPIGRVALLVRYPVKSMAGEILSETLLTESGIANDRLYAFRSSSAPTGMLHLSGRARRQMLGYAPKLNGNGEISVTVPSGETYPIDSTSLIKHFNDHIAQHSHFSLVRSQVPQTDVRPLSLISLQTVQQLSTELGVLLDYRRKRPVFPCEIGRCAGVRRILRSVKDRKRRERRGGTGRMPTQRDASRYQTADLAAIAGPGRYDADPVAQGVADSDGVAGQHMHEFHVDARHRRAGSAQMQRSAGIGEVLTKIGSSLTYTYDLGDGWEHSIVLEKRFSGNDDAEYPICLDGQHACPPEDCGGIPGYFDLLEGSPEPGG